MAMTKTRDGGRSVPAGVGSGHDAGDGGVARPRDRLRTARRVGSHVPRTASRLFTDDQFGVHRRPTHLPAG